MLRLMEVCGTEETSELSRCIGVSYQTMKNYMPPMNRRPATDILVQITDKTSVNLHWLITGQGAKTVSIAPDGIPLDKVIELELPPTRLLLRVISVASPKPKAKITDSA